MLCCIFICLNIAQLPLKYGLALPMFGTSGPESLFKQQNIDPYHTPKEGELLSLTGMPTCVKQTLGTSHHNQRILDTGPKRTCQVVGII